MARNAALPVPSPAITAVDWRDGLTAKQAAFVEHYVDYRNATQAYTHAFDTEASYENRRNEGCRQLAHPAIQAAIKVRQQIATYDSGMGVSWLLQRFLRMANADPRELIGLKVGCCRYCHGADHGYQWREREYVEALAETDRGNADLAAIGKPATLPYPDPAGGLDFNATYPPHPDCPQCHGEGLERFVPRDTDKLSDDALLLYGGVKVKKDGGYEIVIADQAKAAELAGRIMGAFTDNVRLKGAVAHMHVVRDLQGIDPQAASKAYREFIAGNLAV